MARGRGGGKTPERVVELICEAVAKSSQAKVALATGQTRLTIQRYMQGIGEPSQATLEKLAVYFGVSVAELRGEKFLSEVIFNGEGMTATFGDNAPINTSYQTIHDVGVSIILAIQDNLSDEQILDEINGWRRKLNKKL